MEVTNEVVMIITPIVEILQAPNQRRCVVCYTNVVEPLKSPYAPSL